MDDRIRTGDRLDHNQELYQLSYSHHMHDLQGIWPSKPATPILRQCGDTRGLEAITPLPGEKWQLRRSVSNRHPEPNARLRQASGSRCEPALLVRRRPWTRGGRPPSERYGALGHPWFPRRVAIGLRDA